MGTTLFVLALIVALLEGVIRLGGERTKSFKLWGRRIEWFVVIAGILIIAGQYFLGPDNQIADRLEDIERKVEEQACTIDSLKESIRNVPQDDEARRVHLDTVYIQAVCVDEAHEAHTVLDSAVVAIGLGDYGEALVFLDDARQAASGDPATLSEIYFYIGVAHGFSGNHELALASFDSAITYKHDFNEAWYNRGTTLYELGRYDDAIASFDSAIAYKHNKHEAWCNRGNALHQLGRYDDAIASHDSAIAYKHDDHGAWNNRGATLDDLGRYDNAIASYDSAIAYKNDYHDAWYNRGYALDQLGRYDDAIASYDSSIEYKHDFHEAWGNRGAALANLVRYEEALASCDSSSKYNPGDTAVTELRIWILERQHSAEDIME